MIIVLTLIELKLLDFLCFLNFFHLSSCLYLCRQHLTLSFFIFDEKKEPTFLSNLFIYLFCIIFAWVSLLLAQGLLLIISIRWDDLPESSSLSSIKEKTKEIEEFLKVFQVWPNTGTWREKVKEMNINLSLLESSWIPFHHAIQIYGSLESR